MLRRRFGDAKSRPPIASTSGGTGGADSKATMSGSSNTFIPAVGMDALTGNRKEHTVMDYIWLAVVVTVVISAILFWPIWDLLIGSSEKDYFTVLGVSKSAGRGVIKKAYRDLARQWHPDHNPGCGESCRERMRMIQNAYASIISGGGSESDLNAGKATNSDGFDGTLLILLTHRLCDMVILSCEFFFWCVPTWRICRSALIRKILVFGLASCIQIHLIQIRMPLSWLGIIICIYRLSKLPAWEPNNIPSEHFAYLTFVVIPTTVLHGILTLGYTRFFPGWQSGQPLSSWLFYLKLLIGIAHLTGSLMRVPPGLFLTYHIKRVPYLPFTSILRLLWEIGCNDLLSYLIKVPTPFRVCCHVLLLAYLYQRWIYIHVGKKRLNEFGQMVGVQDHEAAMYAGIYQHPSLSGTTAAESVKEKDKRGSSHEPPPTRPPLTPPTITETAENDEQQKSGKGKKKVLQGSSASDGASLGLKFLIGIIILCVLLVCLFPVVGKYFNLLPEKASPATTAQPSPSTKEYPYFNPHSKPQKTEKTSSSSGASSKDGRKNKPKSASGGKSSKKSKSEGREKYDL